MRRRSPNWRSPRACRGGDVGADALLARYDALRRRDVATRVLAVEWLNRSLLSDFLPLQSLRGLGLYALDRIGPLRRLVMREGIAPSAAEPALMRGGRFGRHSGGSANDRQRRVPRHACLWRWPYSCIISLAMKKPKMAKYTIGQVVRHRLFPFRGVVFDVDPEFDNTEEWWQSIPEEVRPRKDQPFYHLFAENAESEYIAYVSEQNLLPDTSGDPIRHPQVAEVFETDESGSYRLHPSLIN